MSFFTALAADQPAPPNSGTGRAVLKLSRIPSELRAAILRIRRPDTALSSEPVLAALFDSSRAAVRSALATLEAEGLAERRRGAGPFVRRTARDLPLGRRADAGGGGRPLAAQLLKVEPRTPSLVEGLAMVLEPAPA